MANLKLLNFAIVDDNSLEKMIEKDILNKYGINNVEYFNSGKELFESGKKYDLYLIDIVLQNEFGKDLIQKIRNNNRKAIIIAVTSLTNSKILSSILNSGADDIIGKPIDENLFISKLKTNIRIHVLNEKIKEVVKEIKNR
ncbi:response regulator [Clostridium senegalense]|uniref:response regulator n=1 Tax=Clostridium senegalense TaxID=1465809 RepID=UPI000288D2B2|nr:response regulator [Clostridium senegalense]